jgi:RHS repeat-associated protein
LGNRSKPAKSALLCSDGANDVVEVDQNGNILARYTQDLGIDEPLAEFRSSTASFYDQDGLGSVTSLSNSSGSLANTYVYKAFGNLASSSGSTANPFQFTGRDYDPETGLRYYRARYYDANTGRFLTEDPIGFDGDPNFYAYVGNNSVNWTDPLGLRKVWACRQRLKAYGGIAGWFWHHTYIKMTEDDGITLVGTWGILGPYPNGKKPQLPLANDPRNNGECKEAKNRRCALDREARVDELIDALDISVLTQTCPSCTPNYHAWIPTDLIHLFDGYNSNTYTYNMIYGAGFQPPPEPGSPGYHRAPGNWYPK